MSIERIKAFHCTLDEIHTEDISLYTAEYDEVVTAYVARFEALPDGIDFDYELSVWRHFNSVINFADFVPQNGEYITGDHATGATPISAEQWEAMHGIGQESVVDERPVMMISRAIVKDTAGYVGKVGADSVRMWRLYATPSGETWGAEWSHGTEWTQSTWGSMQHVQKFIDETADILDIVAEWERY